MKRVLVSILLFFSSVSSIFADGNILRDTVSLSDKCRLKYDLLNFDTFRFHPVNGVDLQETGTFIFNIDTTSVLSTAMRVQYAFLPHIFEPELSLSLNRNNKSFFSLTAGRELHDWKLDPATEMRWIKNTFSALFAHKNFKALIDKKYFSASYTYKPSPKSYVKVSYDRYDIVPMKNNSSFSFFKNGRSYKPNIPINEHADSAIVQNPRYGSSAISLINEFSLGDADDSPLLDISVRYINHVNVFHPQLCLSQTISYSKVDMFHWRINGGFFSGRNPESLSFHEWFHFQTSKKFFPVRNQRTGIVGLVAQDPYFLSTNDWHIDYSLRLFKPRIIFLHIPFLNMLSMGESVVLSSVYTAQHKKLYTEVGYEFLNVLDAFHIGAFASFDGRSYQGTNVRMGVVPQTINRKRGKKPLQL